MNTTFPTDEHIFALSDELVTKLSSLKKDDPEKYITFIESLNERVSAINKILVKYVR